jgi:hypothetical protein
LAPLPAAIAQRRNVTFSPLTKTAMLELPLPSPSTPTASAAVIAKSSTSTLTGPPSGVINVSAILFCGPASDELASANVHAPPSEGQSKPPYRLTPDSCTASEKAPRHTKMRVFCFAAAAKAPRVIVAQGAL